MGRWEMCLVCLKNNQRKILQPILKEQQPCNHQVLPRYPTDICAKKIFHFGWLGLSNFPELQEKNCSSKRSSAFRVTDDRRDTLSQGELICSAFWIFQSLLAPPLVMRPEGARGSWGLGTISHCSKSSECDSVEPERDETFPHRTYVIGNSFEWQNVQISSSIH